MARKVVTDAIEAHLADHWINCPIIPLNGKEPAPTDGTPFVTVQYPVAQPPKRFSISTPYYQEEGTIRLTIFTARGEGLSTVLEWADALAKLFRDRKFAGVQCHVPSSPTFNDSNNQGVYFVAPIIVPYTTYFHD